MVSRSIRVSILLCILDARSYLVLVGAKAEVLDCLTCVLGASKKQGVASSGGTESQLIQSQDLSSSSENACTSGCGEAESSNAELGDGEESVIISDSANDHNSALVIIAGFVSNDSRDRDRRSVDTGHEQSAEDDLVEGGLGSACQERVNIGIASAVGENLRAKKRYSFTRSLRSVSSAKLALLDDEDRFRCQGAENMESCRMSLLHKSSLPTDAPLQRGI